MSKTMKERRKKMGDETVKSTKLPSNFAFLVVDKGQDQRRLSRLDPWQDRRTNIEGQRQGGICGSNRETLFP